VAARVPAEIPTPGASFAGLGALLARRDVLSALLLTLLYFVAIFAVFSYIGPVLQALSPMSGERMSLTLALFGLSGVAGTLLGGVANDRFGSRRTLAVQLSVLGATMVVLPLAAGSSWRDGEDSPALEETHSWTPNSSPGSRSTISLAGTRLSEQPIHKYSGACWRSSRLKKPASAATIRFAQARFFSFNRSSIIMLIAPTAAGHKRRQISRADPGRVSQALDPPHPDRYEDLLALRRRSAP
jgi:MFS family permease